MNVAHIHRLVKTEQWQPAWHECNTALNSDPDNPELLYLMGAVLRAQGHIGLSLPLFSKALSANQKQPNLWMHYGATLHDLHRHNEAIQAFGVVEKMLPTDPMPPANASAAYVQQGKWAEAINQANKALSLDPECYIAHISKSFACLALGRWADGWEHAHYLYGNHLAVRVYNTADKEEPEWDGSPGKTVVVQCDQGVGDIIMFAQCLPEMVKDCKQVIVECAERMAHMIRRNFPGVVVYGTLKKQGQTWAADHDIDAHCHISSLPKFYRRKDSDFPRKAYISPDREKLDKWLGWLEQFPKPWIGVSWKGGIQQTQTHLRSLQLDQLAPVLQKSGTFIDLSYRDNSDEVARWNIMGGSQVVCPQVDVSDYEDTVALVAALDEVVTVTTTVAHVCGALGRSARVLVNEVPQWRYAHRCGDGMIWYPDDSVQLYRVKPGENWGHAINRLAGDL